MKIISKEEMENLIASGKAYQVHLYNARNVLAPRGSMQKESLGSYILEKLIVYYESWTDKKYGDNPDQSTLLKLLQENLKEETDAAWREFLRRINR